MKACGAMNCEKKHYSRGWCLSHYQRLKRTGGLDTPAGTDVPVRQPGRKRGEPKPPPVCNVPTRGLNDYVGACGEDAGPTGMCRGHQRAYASLVRDML